MKFFAFLSVSALLFLNIEAIDVTVAKTTKKDVKKDVATDEVDVIKENIGGLNEVVKALQESSVGTIGITDSGLIVVDLLDKGVYVGNGDIGIIGKGLVGKTFVGNVLGLGNCVDGACGVTKPLGKVNLSVTSLGQKLVGFVNQKDGTVGVVSCKSYPQCSIHNVDKTINDIGVTNVVKKKVVDKSKKTN